jgi:hypothetical protein
MPVTEPGVADQFIKDVKESAEKILKSPQKKTTGGVSILKVLMARISHNRFLIPLQRSLKMTT